MTDKHRTISRLNEELRSETTSATELAQFSRSKARAAKQLFITVSSDDTSALASDERAQNGTTRGALDGIPIAIKDVIDTRGLRTTMGSNIFANNLPSDDARLVKQLKDAGANVIGKTNTQEFSYGIRGDVGAFGVVSNPHDSTRVAGGSSSGSAAAVATGVVPLAVGTDTAGSVRVPAALCGVVGFKPTYQLLDTTGIFPLSPSFDTAGLLANSVSDIALTMHSIGFGGFDLPGDVEGLKFAALTDNPILAGSRTTDATEEYLAQHLNASKVEHPLVSQPAMNFMELYNVVRSREAFLVHQEYVSKTPEKYQPTILAKLQEGENISHTEVAMALRLIKKAAVQYSEKFVSTDILLSSTTPIEAPLLHGQSSTGAKALMSQCLIWNLLGWPALAIPYWVSSSPLPKSIQLIGKPGRDSDVLRAGVYVQQLLAERTVKVGNY